MAFESQVRSLCHAPSPSIEQTFICERVALYAGKRHQIASAQLSDLNVQCLRGDYDRRPRATRGVDRHNTPRLGNSCLKLL
jgi:hypothetical protein